MDRSSASFFSSIKRTLGFILGFLFLFVITAILYLAWYTEAREQEFKEHALIISDDIWALDDDGARSYLKLVLKKDHFLHIRIRIPGDDNFLLIKSPSSKGFSRFLDSLPINVHRSFSEPLFHQGYLIGELEGVQQIRLLLPLLNILLIMLLASLLIGFFAAQRDKRKDLQKEVHRQTANLKRSDRRYYNLVNLLPEMVFETNTKSEILYANQAARQRFGKLLKQEPPPSLLDFLDEGSKQLVVDNFAASLFGNPANLIDVTARDDQQKSFPALIRQSPVFRDNLLAGALLVLIDVTERRELEEQLVRDQKMKAIGLMAGGVAHDLNNILSGIISYPEFILHELEDESRLRGPLEAIRQSGLDAAEVVSDLLTMARGVASATETLDLNSIIRDYLVSADFRELKQRHQGVSVGVRLSESPLFINCSQIHIRKCLMNLIHNAMEAINGSGSLVIASEHAEYTENSSSTPQAAPAIDQLPTSGIYAKLSITDTGLGIESKDLGHIFEPFYSKKILGASGTGLGLAVVWNTVSDHKGHLQVESIPGETVFSLYFPRVLKTSSTPESSQGQMRLGNNQTVLVIDDEARQREITKNLLTMLNYQVVTADSGEAAFDYLLGNHADVLLLDMLMPGWGGRLTYEKILTIKKRQKAIIVSGFAEDEDVRQTMEMGATIFLAKPYTVLELSTALDATLSA